MSDGPTICVHADAGAFLARAESWLLAAEVERAVALTSARYARANEPHYESAPYWATIEEHGEIVGCAFRTPPYRLGVTILPDAAVAPLVANVAAVYRALSGVSGPEQTASAVADAWAEPRGGAWSVVSRQRLFEHKLVVPRSERPRGALRSATAADVRCAHEWGAAFARESGLAAFDGAFCARLLNEGRLYFWDDGVPCCMLGVLRETADAAAIAVIYTPEKLRERGYAAAAVSAFSQQALERGLRHSYLYADPEDPVADAIGRGLGFAVVQDAVDIDFH